MKRKVNSTRNSESGSCQLSELDFTRWWTDNTAMPYYIYLHVNHKLDETVHRVRPREIKGYVVHRLAFDGHNLYWVYDKN